ncbi:signal peptide protein [Paenibacillus thailandensis]|uniref:Signal peptide protein n=1 Tax=Paenibacillus thailandensis TaxID=393250 RepID=A0ABW5QUI5_9BACL
MNHYGYRKPDGPSGSGRFLSLAFGAIVFIIIMSVLFNACSSSNYGGSSVSWSSSDNAGTAGQAKQETTVPWDYRIAEAEVGDLIGQDMTVLPDNELMPNDGNYGTGDKIWALQYMDAEMTTDSDGKNEIKLSAWRTIKTFKTKEEAEADMNKLKVRIKTETKLVGVYKTEYNGETRQFAVLELPSGNRVKQPIDAERYGALKSADKANIILEEVHDFADYDLTYAKFRGWAS